MSYCIELYCILPYCMVLCLTRQYCIVMYYIISISHRTREQSSIYRTKRFYIVLYYTVSYNTIWYLLYYLISFCTLSYRKFVFNETFFSLGYWYNFGSIWCYTIPYFTLPYCLVLYLTKWYYIVMYRIIYA